jgi:hypothetical protein
VKRTVAALLVALTLAGCSAQTSTPGPAAAPESFTFSGSGMQNTSAFTLAGGSYSVAWTATPHSSVGCYHGVSLARTDGGFGVPMLVNALPKAAVSGTTNAYNVKAGEFFFQVSSGCDWTIAIAKP